MSERRKPLISGNWKMNHNHFEAIQTVQKLSYQLTRDDYDAVDVSIHPPFTNLRSVQTVLEADDIPVALGAQHCHWEDKGAFTGEVSPPMLAKLNVRYVIAGHSERRDLFDETDEMVNRKVRAILAAGMTPIMCVGEHLEEREDGTAEQRVSSQVEAGLADVSPEQVAGMVIAYEPIWAIGTGRTATPEDAQTMSATIREVVRRSRAPTRPAACASSTAGRSSPPTPASSWASPTSTAPWWGERRWTRTTSHASCSSVTRRSERAPGW